MTQTAEEIDGRFFDAGLEAFYSGRYTSDDDSDFVVPITADVVVLCKVAGLTFELSYLSEYIDGYTAARQLQRGSEL